MYDEVYTRISFSPPSCLDSAYERHAIDQGFLFDPFDLFKENKEYYETLHNLIPVRELSYNSETKEYEPYISKTNG